MPKATIYEAVHVWAEPRPDPLAPTPWAEAGDCYTSRVTGGRSMRIDAAPRGHKVSSYPAKRICGERSCSTVLSRYNGAAFCWVHESPTLRPGSALRR